MHGGLRRLEGLRAIVTGAGSGIGRAIAVRFAQEGARVACADLNLESAQETVGLLGTPGFATRVDVTKEPEVESLVSITVEHFGGLECIVNNAGVGIAAKITDTTEADWDNVMNVCMKGTFFGMKHAIPAIQRSVHPEHTDGSVINMASIAAFVGLSDRAAYSAAKAGILGMTRAAAMDHIPDGIRVNCIAPGTVDTPWVARITAGYADPEAARAAMHARQPHGRLVTAEEIAAMAAYLASTEAASVVGAAMMVDGGMTAR
jgi:NAD(P)-dependent dehydrogenase (short-subunit alcohol dehydrogenase family)